MRVNARGRQGTAGGWGSDFSLLRPARTRELWDVAFDDPILGEPEVGHDLQAGCVTLGVTLAAGDPE